MQELKNRPLASGALSIKYAIGMLFILSVLSLFILLTLSRIAIYIGFFAVMVISIYPLMKRVTYLPQVFLGFTFNLGTLIAYATVQNKLDIAAITMYLACCLWTIGYDTIYGFNGYK